MGRPLDARGGVSVVEVAIYGPSLFLAAYISSKLGFNRSAGWIYTVVFCIARFLGSIIQLATYNNSSVRLLQAALILNGVAISPLLLATLGVVSRLIDWVSATRGSPLNTKHFRTIQAVLFVGLILSIVGGTNMSYSSDGTYQPQAITKASILLYLAGFIAITTIIIISRQAFTQVPYIERRTLIAILLAWPFLCTRIIYSIMSTFLHNMTFSMVRSDLGVYVAMAVIEEFVVIGIYLALGFFLVRNGSPATGEIVNRPWKSRAADSVEPGRSQLDRVAERHAASVMRARASSSR